MDEKNAGVSSSNCSTNGVDEVILTTDELDGHLELCHRYNTRLDKADQYTTPSKTTTTSSEASDAVPIHKSTRLLIFIKALLNTDAPLMPIYSALTATLQNGATKFDVDLRHVEEDDDQMGNIECERVMKMVKANVELARLVVELTSPAEMLRVNRAAVYSVLTPFEVTSGSDFVKQTRSQSDDSDSPDEDCRILNQKDYAIYLLKYKDLFIRRELFATLCENLLASLRLIHSLANFEARGITSAKRRALIEGRLRYLLVHLVDAILVNLCLARNLLIEKNESLLNLIISRFLDNKFDQVLILLIFFFSFWMHVSFFFHI